MLRIEIPKKHIKFAIRAIAAHQSVMFTSEGVDLFRVDAKDARKGQIWGRGSEQQKLPVNPRRLAVRFTNYLKSMLVKEEDKLV